MLLLWLGLEFLLVLVAVKGERATCETHLKLLLHVSACCGVAGGFCSQITKTLSQTVREQHEVPCQVWEHILALEQFLLPSVVFNITRTPLMFFAVGTGRAQVSTWLLSDRGKERSKPTCRMKRCRASIFRQKHSNSDSYIHVLQTRGLSCPGCSVLSPSSALSCR